MIQIRSSDLRVVDADPRATIAESLALAAAEPWMAGALCTQTDPEAFFPEKGGSTREAKRVCRGCEVRSECLEYALGHEERYGIWGGMSERERRKLRTGRQGKPRALDDEQAEKAVRLYESGVSGNELAAFFGVSDKTVLRALHERGVQTRGRGGRPRRGHGPWADSDEWRHGRHIEDVTLPDHEQERTA